jgi:hypothetical protein
VIITILVALKYAGHDYISGIQLTTLNRQPEGLPSSAGMVLRDSFDWVGLLLVFALVGLAIIWRHGVRARLFMGVLIVADILAPIEQARLHTTIALHKHVTFGAWFACIAVGYVISRASLVHRWKGWRIGLAGAIFIGAFGTLQANSWFFSGWPNTTILNRDVARVMTKAGCPCMLADYTIIEYNLNIQSQWRDITGPYAFSYYSYTEHKQLFGMPAYQAAIREGHFSVVELNPVADLPVYQTLNRELMADKEYRLVYRAPDSLIPGMPLEVWEYEP